MTTDFITKISFLQIQWLFNERPVHGKDFLVSVSGDRQVLTIPVVGDAHVGTISCVAENAAGRAICSAKVEIGKLIYIFLLYILFASFTNRSFFNIPIIYYFNFFISSVKCWK